MTSEAYACVLHYVGSDGTVLTACSWSLLATNDDYI